MGFMTTSPAMGDPGRWRQRVSTAVLIVMLVLVTAGCSNTTDPTSSVGHSAPTAAPTANTHTPTAADCTEVDFPLIDIPPRAEGEPTVKIPQPPGWEDMTQRIGTSNRFALANPALNANHAITTATVDLDSDPGSWSPQELFDYEVSNLISKAGAEIQSITATTVCGQPAQIVEFTSDTFGHDGAEGVSSTVTGLMAVAEFDNISYAVNLLVATSEPDNPSYQRDSKAILDGFVFLPPTPGERSG